MTLFERFDRHRRLYIGLLFFTYLFINNSINATSVWMEQNRNGKPAIELWEPFCWEYTSTLSILLIAPLIFYLYSLYPPRLTKIWQQLIKHLLGTLLFSVLHVGLMVWFRELIYSWQGGDYNFGPILREFLYEYRKDAWGYLFFYAMYYLYQFVYSRLKGEANLIESVEQSTTSQSKVPGHLLVRKLDKEFLVKVSDIEWMESSGNYVNLYSGGRIYPLRATLSATLERLEAAGFSRIHRSYGVNHQAIDNISYQPSGDGEITLKSGHKLNLSRRYKDQFKQQLEIKNDSA
ncbi:LytR/AlgR family response regulator transcription factor [Neptunicella sp. SCSIO 80796]|uniref:LytR/AlgR family response regulator transcription factor n=1 Tax=Neptunicella plasticusilytica TaxID=3117012 RepID=UPI003A4DDF66